jgi:RHH-type proline utilization regulon transcriptional repressor/proline dehydrogenase/delta 1-pyrroline-5-carboxylate dehydrogenase
LDPARALDDHALALATRDAELRAALFRLVDVMPACRTLDELGRHLAGLVGELADHDRLRRAAGRATRTKGGRVAVGAAVATGVRHTAHRFIAGPTPAAASRELGRLWRDGIAASVDLLGEATVSSEEADRYAAHCAKALDQLTRVCGTWPARPLLEHDSAGPIARANMSVKVSSLTAVLRSQAPERGLADAATRMRPLLEAAHALGAHLHIDMESVDALETTVGVALDLLDEAAFAEGPSAGIVIQAYLRESSALVGRVLDWAQRSRRAVPLTVRLVKGAYWDREIAEAQQHGWPVPVFTDKAECDRNFEDLTRRLLDARPLVRVAIGSHNLRSIAHAIAYNRLTGGRDEDLELQVLRGLGDDLAGGLCALGMRVRVYSPVGDLVAGMAYLVRRLLENTSNESFLVAQANGVSLHDLLTAP